MWRIIAAFAFEPWDSAEFSGQRKLDPLRLRINRSDRLVGNIPDEAVNSPNYPRLLHGIAARRLARPLGPTVWSRKDPTALCSSLGTQGSRRASTHR